MAESPAVVTESEDPPTRARRASRFVHAKRRVEHIVEGLPRLTDAQLAELARILTDGGDR